MSVYPIHELGEPTPPLWIISEWLLNKHEGGVYIEAFAPTSVSSAEGWRALERVGACKERRWGERVCMCVRAPLCMCVKDEAERSVTSWGEVSPVSQSGCVAVEERHSGRREVSSEGRRRKRRYLLFLSSCWSSWRESLDGVICSTMGCSLCTLQKPEEQYKLLYEVCQVLWPSWRKSSLNSLSCF